MCGIAGALGPDISGTPLLAHLARRGPDHVGELRHGSLHAVHSRLGIVASRDPAAHQPLWHEGRALICNGYIGNAGEVMDELGLARAASDCAALLAAYVSRRFDGIRRLRGQFAGALLDPDAGELILVRDLSGICPLYYAVGAHGTLFASQASWLAGYLDGVAGVAPSLDGDAVDQFRSLGYVIAPGTLRAGIHQVEPGTAVVFDLETGALRRTVRWMQGMLTGAPPGDGLDVLLCRAAARSLGGDFPPWVLLSGGLDSLLVLHCAVEAGAKPAAVTLVYPGGANADEVATAMAFAEHYGVRLHLVDAERPSEVATAERMRTRVDWPFDGGSLIPKITLADFIQARGGRVVLGGTGADELFGGYTRHQRRMEMLRRGARRASHRAERAFFDRHVASARHGDAAWRLFLEHGDDYADAGFVYDLLEISMCHNPRVDSCFANVSLEYRPVFQDVDVTRAAAALSLHDKSELGRPKAALRRAFAGQVDGRFLDVPKKPLRYAQMGPNAAWRGTVFQVWKEANMKLSVGESMGSR